MKVILPEGDPMTIRLAVSFTVERDSRYSTESQSIFDYITDELHHGDD